MTNFTWSWVEMCGPGGLVPWYPTKHDIGACFQQIFLQVPVHMLFAITSAYCYGIRHEQRSSVVYRKWTIRVRLLCSIAIALMPIVEAVVNVTYTNGMFRLVDYLTAGVQVVAWSVHSGYVHSLRHRPNIHGPVILRVLWTLTAVLSVINLRSLILVGTDAPSPIPLDFETAVIVFQCIYGLTFATCCFKTRQDEEPLISERSLPGYYHSFRDDTEHEYLGVAMERVSSLSYLSFYWVHTVLVKATSKKLNSCDDLYDLPHNLNTSHLCVKLQLALNGAPEPESQVEDVAYRQNKSLLRALHKCFGLEFYSIGILKLISDILNFGGPILLNMLVQLIENKNESERWGYVLVAGLFASTLFSSLLNTHFTFLMSQVGLKIRGALITAVYRKTLNISYSSVHSFTVGEIVNFMSTDTERIVNACPSFHTFWSIPFQMIVSFYLLYQQVGVAFLAGVAFSIFLIPINKLIAGKIGEYATKMMAAKDERVTAVSETLRGIRVLKLHVWEQHFLEKIMGIRRQELKHLRGRKYLDALCVYFWSTTPVLVSILTLGTYVLLGNELKASVVFTTIALLNMLIVPLNAFPWVLNGLIESWVSVKRIQKLIDLPDLNLRDYYSQEVGDLALQQLRVEWDASTHEAVAPAGLRNISITVEKGQLVGVIGAVGSGKSTLLHALLGELNCTDGQIVVPNWEGGFGLVTQTAWLQHGTFRDNILFGKSFDSGKYRNVLEACCLAEDISSMFGGDMARIGENGTTLSGGQKARLALARAVYQDKDIYLLDDVLSALDPPVARHIYTNVICGLLRDKTRILCTNNALFLTNADLIVHLEKGEISRAGKPCDVLPNFDDLASYDTESMASYKESRDEDEPGEDRNEEVSQTGAVSASVYGRYALAVGPLLVILIFCSLTLMQFSRNASDYWLSVWVSTSNATLIETPTNYYLYVYLVIVGSNTLFTLFRAFLFAYGGLQAAKTVHEQLLNKVVNSKISFFDITPFGRILNRFSSDMYAVDDSLPFITNILFAQVFALFGSLAVTFYGLPLVVLLIAPLVPLYYYLQTTYRPCSRELKRLGSTSLSPLYSHFTETLQGIVTIRAFRSLSRFQRRSEEYLDNNQRAMFAGFAASAWLSLRLQMMGVVIISGVALIAVSQHQFDVVEPALVGLTVAYALSITGLLSGVVSSMVETEREFVALERVSQYIDDIELENDKGNHPPFAWPSQGVVSFQCVYLRYQDYLAPSLNGVSFETRPAEKIGIVGRTGAGKSSLITALLRMVPVYDGDISIDAVNVNSVSLTGLRSRVTVIPQDPCLFKGTLRSNLDPLTEYPDQELWVALKKCQINEFVVGLGGLTARVEMNGCNYSQGQRQLLCLTRAILKNSKIVCIDEGTASVDHETDHRIQQTIRSCFRQSTVITIAHRISTVMDRDRLLVLRNGEVVEFDTPANLANDPTSYFYKLSQQTIKN